MGKKRNLSEYNKGSLPSAKNRRFGIIVSEWNPEITGALYNGAFSSLLENGASEADIITKYVPGSFELPLGAKYLIENARVDAVICLGCVIQGKTRHFDFICHSVANTIAQLNVEYNIPVIFGVLTTDNFQQAKERSGGQHGNKGTEAAVVAIKMAALKEDIQKSNNE